MPRLLRDLHGQVVWTGPRPLPGVKVIFGFASAPEHYGVTFGRRILVELQLADGASVDLVPQQDLDLNAIGIAPLGMNGFENQHKAVLARVLRLEVVHAGQGREFGFSMHLEPCEESPSGVVLAWSWPSPHQTRHVPSAAFVAPGKGPSCPVTLAELYPVIPEERQAA